MASSVMTPVMTPPRRAIRTELGRWCEEAATRLLVGSSGGIERVGAALVCVRLFRALSDTINIHCAFSTAGRRVRSVAREGAELRVTIDSVGWPPEQISSNFLHGCPTLVVLQLPLPSNGAAPKQVRHCFCAACPRLEHITLAGLAHVTSVGFRFLSGCSSLTALDLTPLAAVVDVGGYFLAGCSSLRALDLTPLAAVTRVGNYFLSDSSSLTALDLTPLAQ
jgi:hypothetical protein